MPFIRYKPQKQWGRYFTRTFRHKSRLRNQSDRQHFYVDNELMAKFPIYNPLDPNFFRSHESITDYEPPEHLRLKGPENHILYKPVKAFVFNGTVGLTDGIDEACAIINAPPARPFPTNFFMQHSLDDLLPDNFAEKVRDAIMHGERYDATFEKLPKRFDPIIFWTYQRPYYGSPVWKRNNVIFNDLYRITLLTLLPKLNSLLSDFRCDFDYTLNSYLSSSASGLKAPLVFQHTPHMVVQVNQPLTPLASTEEVDQTRLLNVPNIYPISPTIDLKQSNIYSDVTMVPRKVISNLHLNTTFCTRVQDQKYPWTSEQNAANAVLHCFGAALVEATRRGAPEYVDGVQRLKRPVFVKAVQIVDGRLDLTAVQLNTTDLTQCDGGVKNLVWLEKGIPLYKPKPFYENMLEVENFDFETVKKFVAFLLYR